MNALNDLNDKIHRKFNNDTKFYFSLEFTYTKTIISIILYDGIANRCKSAFYTVSRGLLLKIV